MYGSIIILVLIIGAFMLFNREGNPETRLETAVVKTESNNETSPMRLTRETFLAWAVENNATILDIRTPEEYESGHVFGAVNIDYYSPEFQNQIASLDKNKAYAVYCRSGARSGEAMKLMKGMGFTKIADLQGGISALK